MHRVIQVKGTRFGVLTLSEEDVLHFPQGLIGFEQCRRWVLLADEANPRVGWLQSLDRLDVAVSVVSPRRYVEGYRVRVASPQLVALELGEKDRAYVLVVVAQHEDRATMNLKAPLLINLDRRRGAQVITRDEQPLRLDFPPAPVHLRKSA